MTRQQHSCSYRTAENLTKLEDRCEIRLRFVNLKETCYMNSGHWLGVTDDFFLSDIYDVRRQTEGRLLSKI